MPVIPRSPPAALRTRLRRLARRLVKGSLALSFLGNCGGEPPPPPEQPNVIVYLVDTLRQDHLGLYGYERATTKHLDALAEEAINFPNAYAPSSWTKASTATALTGLYPTQHGATSRTSRLPTRSRLISEYLAPLGYYTAAVITNPFVVSHWGFNRAYDEFHDLGARAPGPQGWQNIRAEQVHEKVFEILDAPRPADQPFLMYVHTIDVHGPNDPTAPYDTLFTETPRGPGYPGRLDGESPPEAVQDTVDLYDAEIRYMDDQLGAFLGGLKDRGLYDDTIIWFVSDHGEEFLDHGRGGHGSQLFNESVKVPMLLKLPGGELGGSVVDAPVSLVDLLATQLALVGQEPPPELHGLDLRDLVDGPAPSRPLFFDLNLISGPEQTLFLSHGVLVDRFKYFEVSRPEPTRHLYDLETDPDETRNLAALDEPRITSKLEELTNILELHRAASRSGLVLTFIGDKQAGRSVEVVLRTEGTFVSAEGLDQEAAARPEIAEGGQELRMTLDLSPFRNNVMKHAIEQDNDGLHLRLDPPDAVVTLVSAHIDGGIQLPVFLGPARTETQAPVEVGPLEPDLLVPDLGVLFTEEERNPAVGQDQDELRIRPGVYVVALPGAELEAEMTPEMYERLKALGYVR